MRNDDLKLILDTQFSAVRATIMAESEIQNLKIDAIINHQEWQNDKLGKHDEKIIDLEKYASNRDAVKKALGKSFVVGCSILGAAGTIVGILHVIGK